ncbi:phage tail assembly chaperone [Pleomorphomonas koreensis]|uniref:phage tail assembly chaperone n=1 Tax=Pleomorphomonas koreensis TaxID=257440 RepID=UPI00069E5D5E|nr:phage tail assembly chaperone [Pleomorphomonas koreensis]
MKLPPDAFWAMTPRELAAALRAHRRPAAAEPLERGAFDLLMHRFPDHNGGPDGRDNRYQ